MRRAFGQGLERLSDRYSDFIVSNLARCARSWLVVEPVHAVFGEAVAPSANRMRANPEPRSDLIVLKAAGCRQNDTRPVRQRLRGPMLARQ